MARELGGSQISALLESVPGIASVLRSPVADALVQMVRAGAGLEPFRYDNAQELVQYAVRRGLIGASEGEEVLTSVKQGTSRRGRAATEAAKAPKKQSSSRRASKPTSTKPQVRPRPGRPVKKALKRIKRR